MRGPWVDERDVLAGLCHVGPGIAANGAHAHDRDLVPHGFLPAVVAGSVASLARNAREVSGNPGLAKAFDQVFAVLGAQLT